MRDWQEASDRARKVEEQHRAPTDGGQTLEAAVLRFLADKESQHLREDTLSKLRRIFEKSMMSWFRDRGIVLLKDVTLPELQAWRAPWLDGPPEPAPRML